MSLADENLVIYAYKDINDPASGRLFSIPHEVYTDPKYAVSGGAAATPTLLLSLGTVAANMTNDGTGTGGFCYLLNIPALRPPTIDPTAVPRADSASSQRATQGLSPKELVGAIQTLVNSAKSGQASEEHAVLKQLKDVVDSLP
jgi:hypothetical protein